ncbi:PEPxxWA-CTERM sorting domain-containing protein [Sphingomonas sp. RS2018]
MKTIYALAVAATLAATGTADAATYVSTARTVGAGSVNLSITTDGTIGTLTTANITAYSIAVTDPTGAITLTRANSALGIAGNAFTATTSNLQFNFGAAGYALFQSPTFGSGGPFYCLQGGTSACFDGAGAAEGLDSVSCCGSVERTARTGVFTVASVTTSAVPEPATWAMMMLGFGGMGFALRRRAKVTTRVRFA